MYGRQLAPSNLFSFSFNWFRKHMFYAIVQFNILPPPTTQFWPKICGCNLISYIYTWWFITYMWNIFQLLSSDIVWCHHGWLSSEDNYLKEVKDGSHTMIFHCARVLTIDLFYLWGIVIDFANFCGFKWMVVDLHSLEWMVVDFCGHEWMVVDFCVHEWMVVDLRGHR